MQIKIGSCPRATPDFSIYRLCYCSRAGSGAAGASGTRLGYRRREGPASVGARQAGPDGCAGKLGVVLRSPLTLVPSSRGTTSLGSDGLTARRGRMGVPACWGLRPPRDSTPCPRHWFGLFGLRPMGEAVAGLDSLQPGGGGETELDEPSAGGECGAPPEWWSLRLSGRGASLPANPCSFVAGHHVFGVGWASGKLGGTLPARRVLKSDA